MKISIAITFVLYTLFSSAQTDYRDAFLGLYYTNTPPCVNLNEQSPPNHYVFIKKDSTNSTGIVVTDTSFAGSSGFIHPCSLNQSDSTYYDGMQLGKFWHTDSLKITVPGWACPPGHIYYLQKIVPVGLYPSKDKLVSVYLFPNPAIHSFNILLSGSNEQTELELLDATGRVLIKETFYKSSEINVDPLSRGIYFVRVKGSDFTLSKCLVLTD